MTSAKKITVNQVLWECFRYFANNDESNAAIHCSPTRYSPITFRLAEHISESFQSCSVDLGLEVRLKTVLEHLGKYREDEGR